MKSWNGWFILAFFVLFFFGRAFPAEECLPCMKNLETLGQGLIKQYEKEAKEQGPLQTMAQKIWESTGISVAINAALEEGFQSVAPLFMIILGVILIALSIGTGRGTMLLIPIGFGCIFANLAASGLQDEGGTLLTLSNFGQRSGLFSLIILLGIGAMTDFGPLLASPSALFLRAAGQFGMVTTWLGGLALAQWLPGVHFSLPEVAAAAIIGTANGPMAIFLAQKLAPGMLGVIGLSFYCSVALAPMIGRFITRRLVSHGEREGMVNSHLQQRSITRGEKLFFALGMLLLTLVLLPLATPFMGILLLGNLLRECGVGERLTPAVQSCLLHLTTIFFGLGIGSQLSAAMFFQPATLFLLVLGPLAFGVGTTLSILIVKLVNFFWKEKIHHWMGPTSEALPENGYQIHMMGPQEGAGLLISMLVAGIFLAALS